MTTRAGAMDGKILLLSIILPVLDKVEEASALGNGFCLHRAVEARRMEFVLGWQPLCTYAETYRVLPVCPDLDALSIYL